MNSSRRAAAPLTAAAAAALAVGLVVAGGGTSVAAKLVTSKVAAIRGAESRDFRQVFIIVFLCSKPAVRPC